MSKILKKGNKLVEILQKVVPMEKLEGLEDFYLMKQKTQFAIREVQAYYIKNTDMVFVLGSLDLAVKTAKEAAEKRRAKQAEMQKSQPEHQHIVEEACSSKNSEDVVEDVSNDEQKLSKPADSELSITEDDITVVMEQGGIATREEAIKLLKENGGDPLSILMALNK